MKEYPFTPHAEEALRLANIRVLGLMTIPPVEVNPGESTQYFEKVRALYVDMNSNLFHNKLECLSMGMSGDFMKTVLQAIHEESVRQQIEIINGRKI